jgi:hypothetical protein
MFMETTAVCCENGMYRYIYIPLDLIKLRGKCSLEHDMEVAVRILLAESVNGLSEPCELQTEDQ